MLAFVLNFITTGVKWGIDMFISLLDGTGMFAPFVAIFAIVCIVRFILVPLLGGGLSKGSAKSKNDE